MKSYLYFILYLTTLHHCISAMEAPPARPVSPGKSITHEKIKEYIATNNTQAIESLVAEGLNPNKQIEGKTLLEHALLQEKPKNEMLATLIVHGAQVDVESLPTPLPPIIRLALEPVIIDVKEGGFPAVYEFPFRLFLEYGFAAHIQALNNYSRLATTPEIVGLPKCWATLRSNIFTDHHQNHLTKVLASQSSMTLEKRQLISELQYTIFYKNYQLWEEKIGKCDCGDQHT